MKTLTLYKLSVISLSYTEDIGLLQGKNNFLLNWRSVLFYIERCHAVKNNINVSVP